MYLDIFSKFQEKLKAVSPLTAEPTFSFLTPSSQNCFSKKTHKQIGVCTRQTWFDKNNFTKTNIIETNNTHVEMSKFAGELWENWAVDLFKQSGFYVSKQVLSTYPKHFVKGFVDVLIESPVDKQLQLVEIKTYDGSNYFNNTIYGTSEVRPTPKISHLLQAFRYLLIHKNKLAAVNLIYIDRSCSAWFKNKQFYITLFEHEGDLYPKIEVMWGDSLTTYINQDISEQALLASEEYLILALKNKKEPPAADYVSSYTAEEIEDRFQRGLIYKTSYNKYKANNSYVIGDFECNYCPYNKGTCQLHD